MKIRNKKGFTLIELLVVIAIIGILTTVVLVMLGGAKDKSKAGSAKATMANLKTQAAQYISSNADFGNILNGPNCNTGMFTTDQTIANQIAAIKGYVGTTITCTSDKSPGTADTAWAVYVTLPGTGAGTWCVDSNNTAKAGTDADGDGDCD